MAAMNAADLDSLAAMLDKNRAFERPAGQATGFSLEEHTSERAGSGPGSAVVVAASGVDAASSSPPRGDPAGIALPPTVVDHQLRLPQPSHGKEAERKRQLAQPARPRGDEIWTQAELQALFVQQRKDGPAPVAAAARAAAAAAVAAGQQPAATLWRPGPADAGTFEEPAHTVLYQQKVSAEDVYLGVDFTRDASSAGSDGVTVRIELPRVEAVSAIAMEVDAYELRVSVAGVYYLAAPLPRRVQKAGGADAAWDALKKLLTVRLKADHGDGSDVKIVT
ncbi:pre-RNA processing PIH1/Nop17 [Novymonas esmeraldas]|uniref:Pre-RNA processing PIH1/Nop17 n=1 Tax=Novymonas esmeraldas TaxID=1808958 RepID=A0AAW0F176_9TRYP